MSGSGVSWAICNSAPHARQTTTPASHHSSYFTGRMPFLPPNQQRQSTEGNNSLNSPLLTTQNAGTRKMFPCSLAIIVGIIHYLQLITRLFYV